MKCVTWNNKNLLHASKKRLEIFHSVNPHPLVETKVIKFLSTINYCEESNFDLHLPLSTYCWSYCVKIMSISFYAGRFSSIDPFFKRREHVSLPNVSVCYLSSPSVNTQNTLSPRNSLLREAFEQLATFVQMKTYVSLFVREK